MKADFQNDPLLSDAVAAINKAATTEEEVSVRVERLAWIRRILADRMKTLKDQL